MPRLPSFLLLLFLFGCEKNKPSEAVAQLPAETQSGANTFGCKLNGEIWLPKGAAFTTPAYDVQYYKTNGYLYLTLNQSNTEQNIKIKASNIFGTGIYSLNPSVLRAVEYVKLQATCSDYNRTNTTQSGVIEIAKIDTTNRIVSGRFSGTLKQSGCPDIVITEGRFDFQMTVYN